MRMVRAILIDPFSKSVSEIQHDASDYKQIYAALSNPVDVDCFTVVRVNDHDSIFLDDEGLYKADQAYFSWAGYPQPLAGKGLLLGADEEGETIGCSMSLEDAKASVSFISGIAFSHIETSEGETDDPLLGKCWTIENRPVFTKKE